MEIQIQIHTCGNAIANTDANTNTNTDINTNANTYGTTNPKTCGNTNVSTDKNLNAKQIQIHADVARPPTLYEDIPENTVYKI